MTISGPLRSEGVTFAQDDLAILESNNNSLTDKVKHLAGKVKEFYKEFSNIGYIYTMQEMTIPFYYSDDEEDVVKTDHWKENYFDYIGDNQNQFNERMTAIMEKAKNLMNKASAEQKIQIFTILTSDTEIHVHYGKETLNWQRSDMLRPYYYQLNELKNKV